jgi:S-DNA-T family DNA segregation ATPase FtsK/SpoIIIE
LAGRPGLDVLLSLTFLPTVLALLPWHWLWLHAVPVGGQAGMLMAGLLVTYLNLQGAWLVAGALAAVGLYFASAVSFQIITESLQTRWFQARDRWRNWREKRAERREERIAEREARREQEGRPEGSPILIPGADSLEGQASLRPPPGFFARLFRRRRAAEIDPEEIPAFQRAQLQPDAEASAGEARRTSIWERAADEPERGPSGRPSSAGTQSNLSPVAPIPVAATPFAAASLGAIPAAASAAALQSVPARPQFSTRPELAEARAREPRIPEPRPIATPLEAISFEAPPAQPAYEPVASGPSADEIAIRERADAELRAAALASKQVSGFKMPPSTLLNPADGPQSIREDELREEARVLVEKCAEFDVRGQVVQINPGPMVTTYEFKPEAGVKYSRVTGLADDLCLAMRAESILIERMAGKSTVGIQVPNRTRETIHLREVIESENFHKAKSRLTLSMGKDINGRIVTADLAGMPHVLIAGSTGSGKSVAINAMIMSLLYRTTPAQVRLILVDPKRVELGMYEGIPHLFTPIITEVKLAANALRNAVREMERRLKLLASRSVRNIDQYNKLFEGSMPSLFDDAENEEPLPYIVIIIDELADLMMLDRSNVEESITRLAQMARAVGIHLILATQRPSVDVITGLIKANIPTRISFRLATKVDSRTILDTNGAESLLGRGDMLFLPPGTSRLMRLHAPFVSEKETAAVVGFWKAQGQAEYVEGFLESPKEEHQNVDGSNSDPDENDPLFNDAVQLVFEFGKASTSLLQRRLRIGYGRAAHLIDLMESDGLVGPADGSRPRELLKAPGWLHEVSASAIE